MVSHGGFVASYRVSTDKQGKSGLGIDERARLPHPDVSSQWLSLGSNSEEVVPSPISGGWGWSQVGPGAPEPTCAVRMIVR